MSVVGATDRALSFRYILSVFTPILLFVGNSNQLQSAPLISGTLEQQAAVQHDLIEQIYAEQRDASNKALLELEPTDFASSVILHDKLVRVLFSLYVSRPSWSSADRFMTFKCLQGYPRKYIWDYFRAECGSSCAFFATHVR